MLSETFTIALVGASDQPERASYQVMAYLLKQGYRVIPVSPKVAGKMLPGQRGYATLAQIPEPIDMINVFCRSNVAPAIAREAVAIGAKTLWLQLGIVSKEAESIARAGGLRVVMDRCPKIEIPRPEIEK